MFGNTQMPIWRFYVERQSCYRWLFKVWCCPPFVVNPEPCLLERATDALSLTYSNSECYLSRELGRDLFCCELWLSRRFVWYLSPVFVSKVVFLWKSCLWAEVNFFDGKSKENEEIYNDLEQIGFGKCEARKALRRFFFSVEYPFERNYFSFPTVDANIISQNGNEINCDNEWN